MGAVPILFASLPLLAQTFLIHVSVLRDDGGDALGMPHSQSEADRGAVIKDIHGKLRQSDSLCKLIDDASLYRFGCPHTCSCLVMMNESSMDIARTPKITIRLMEVGTSI